MPAEPSNPAKKPTQPPRRLKLSQAVVEKLRPDPDKPAITYWDQNLPGFGIRVSPLGRKSWVAMYRVVGPKPIECMETIGPLTVIPSLADARERARRSMDLARQGTHPTRMRKQQLEAEQVAAAQDAYRLEQLLEDFISKRHKHSRPSTVYESRRLMRRALPFIGNLPVKNITKADVRSMIEKLENTRVNKWRGIDKGGAVSEASGVLRHLRSCFRWALAQDIIERDPTIGIDDPAPKGERERVLSESEIIALWRVCEQIKYPFGPLIQLLICTGARCREIGDMPWRELDLDRHVWNLPKERAKNGRPHDTHLSDLTLEIIARLPRIAGDAGYLFSTSGKRSVTSYSDTKVKIDKLLAEHLPNMKPWVLHDIRRTVASTMADSERGLGIAPHVLDRILNHVSGAGAIQGVAAVYNRNQYAPERRAALDAWSSYLTGLVYPERALANVVTMRAR